jgi:lipopolysaccharide transport system ATP-binding protein
MSALVHFDGVTKAYRRGLLRFNPRLVLPGRLGDSLKGDIHYALRDVDFELEAGRSLGIIGHNGAGKSTLLKLVAGVTSATRGRVTVRGRTAALIELGAGFHPEMTGRENIDFSAAVLGMGRNTLRRVMPEIIDFAEIGDYLDTPVKRYSSGMLARLGFAVASHLDAEILVIDEVLSVGDAAFQRRCHNRIQQRRSEGAAILYVTHALWTLSLVCDEAFLLSEGRVVKRGTPEDVVHGYLDSLDAGSRQPGLPAGDALTALRIDRPTISPGEALTVFVEVDLDEPAPGGTVLVTITSQGLNVFASTSSIDAGVGFDGRGHTDFTCHLDSVPLVPGDYEIYAMFLREPSSPTVDDHRRISLRIEGEPTEPTRGPVALSSRWEVRRSSALS